MFFNISIKKRFNIFLLLKYEYFRFFRAMPVSMRSIIATFSRFLNPKIYPNFLKEFLKYSPN